VVPRSLQPFIGGFWWSPNAFSVVPQPCLIFNWGTAWFYRVCSQETTLFMSPVCVRPSCTRTFLASKVTGRISR
jgi:hypothetical protein